MFKFITDWFKRDKTPDIKGYDMQAKLNTETRAKISSTRGALDTLIIELNNKKVKHNG